jgi:hypothetical protein
MNKKEIIKQGVNLFNKHFPKDKHTTEKEKTSLVKFFIDLHKVTNSNSNLANKTIKVLQSKVKTYEQDIEEVNKEKYKASLRSANDLKGTTKLF